MMTTASMLLVASLLVAVSPAMGGDLRMIKFSAPPDRPPSRATDRLEEDLAYWGAEGSLTSKWEVQCVETDALAGIALRCLIITGQPYASVYTYRPLMPRAMSSRIFSLNVAFKLSAFDVEPPETAMASPPPATAPAEEPPPVQAVEFLVKHLHQLHNYEWRLQWRSADANGPRWFYWDPKATGQGWVPTELPADLALDQWHTLRLEGRVWNGKVRYRSVVIDGITNALDVTASPTDLAERSAGLSVGVHFIANARADPCQMLVDDLRCEF
jgi:hypothetical protein